MPGWGLEIDEQVYQSKYARIERHWEI